MSVGEVISALPLIKQIQKDEPAIPIYLSVSTIAGRRVAEREAESLVEGVFYAPIDYVGCVRRTIRTVRPALLIVLETEIWPHLYAEARYAGASLAIVNGRISDRTWKRYRRLTWLFNPVLQLANAVYVQSATDLDRYRSLGVNEANLHVEANLKYDAATPEVGTEIPVFNAGKVWIAASTVGPNERGSLEKHAVDEDDIVIRAFETLAKEFPKLLLILAPRQPARFQVVAEKLERAALHFIRRSAMKAGSSQALQLPGVLLLDTLGELSSAYPLADAVFVGGSIAPRGGHNIIEPGAAGAAVVVGPHMQNFAAILSDFVAAHAIVQIQSEAELLPAIRSLLTDSSIGERLGKFARHLVENRRGVSQRLSPALLELYFRGRHSTPRGFISNFWLSSLAALWQEGGQRKRERGERYAWSVTPLPVPVISIGGITVGGSGKTPFSVYLASQLRQRNYAPAILTRGYRRRSPAKSVVLGAGANVRPSLTGDEAQIFLRSGVGPIGIGANRYETARLLLSQFPATDILLLDDGFQHARLRRDLDIVLIDGLDPFGGKEVAPLGCLREPLSSLGRASLFVVTRAESDVRFRTISERLHDWNPTAPVFRTRLIARHWHDYRSGDRIEVKARRVAAFCGLGNPQNFWDTLEALGLDLVFRWSFNDHHVYRPLELRYLASQAVFHGADLLVTTEKDRMNFPPGLDASMFPLTLAWLEVELELQDSAAFFAFVESCLGRQSAA